MKEEKEEGEEEKRRVEVGREKKVGKQKVRLKE